MLFEDLGLSKKMLTAVAKKGFEEPTEIQAQAIPVILKNESNLIAQAQTGTGKTAAFGLPLLELIDVSQNQVQVLVLAPTRELAIQVAEEIASFRIDKQLKIIPVYGGQSIDQQLRRLKKGAHIVVGTPGRIIDHLNRKTLKLDKISHLVLDEADEMLNMGFVDALEEIMKHTSKEKKTILFSATMPDKIRELAGTYMEGYEHIVIRKKQLTANLTEQIYFEVKASDKFEALCRIVDIEDAFYGLVFCRTKNNVDEVANHLTERGYDAEAIHGDISQAQREKTLQNFKKGRSNILVATDVAARGIDVNDLTHVINYSLPQDPESYVHRIGRTGRAGKEGTAITFITPGEYKRLMFIQRITKTDIKRSKLPKVNEIIEARKKKINDDLINISNEEIEDNFYNWTDTLLENNDYKNIIASLLKYAFEEDLNPDAYGEINELNGKDRNIDKEGKARLFVALGRKDGINAKKLVDLVLSRVKLRYKEINSVEVLDTFSFITVPFSKAELVVQSFKQKGKKPLVTHAKTKTKRKK